MALDYPDVLNDVTDAQKRYESGVVQYLAEFAPNRVPAGQVAMLALSMQNVVDGQASIAVHLDLPASRGKLKRLQQPLFEIFQPDMRLALENAEVGQVVIPVRIMPHVPPGEYEFSVSIQSSTSSQCERVRPKEAPNRVGDLKIRHPQGMGIAQIASWGFESARKAKQSFSLSVTDAQELLDAVELKPAFSSLWTPASWELIPEARREANERRAFATTQLTRDALYVGFLRETQSVFSNIGVELHLGEAIFIARMLTYTVTYLMGSSEWQDCLLVPIYAYASANGQDTDDALWLVTGLGYSHVLELAIAIAFSLVEDVLHRQPWDVAVQRAVREFVLECFHEGVSLPAEFLYLPLILGGMAIAREVRMEGEDVQESLRLVNEAKREKAEVFADADLQEANDAFDRMLRLYARG